jgi:hypothetical protein
MGSEIVFLFTPLCLGALVFLLFLASKKQFRVAAILCLLASGLFTVFTVPLVPNWSFWTQAGFYSFAFLLAAVIALPTLLVLSSFVPSRSDGPSK